MPPRGLSTQAAPPPAGPGSEQVVDGAVVADQLDARLELVPDVVEIAALAEHFGNVVAFSSASSISSASPIVDAPAARAQASTLRVVLDGSNSSRLVPNGAPIGSSPVCGGRDGNILTHCARRTRPAHADPGGSC